MNISPQIRGKKPSKLMLFATSRAGILSTVIVVCTITFLLFYSGKVLKTNSVVPPGALREKKITPGNPSAAGGKSVRGSGAASSQALSDTLVYNQHLKNMSNGDSSGKWPVKTAYPNDGAMLPYKRIIAFYGNLYSKRMGILGELPPAQMLDKLQREVAAWQLADSSVLTVPALHYIAVTAQSAPGNNGKYRLRMPFHQIDSVLKLARAINAVVFLDIQSGQSTLQEEIPALEPYLKMPDVHLGIDPEFSMKGGSAPGKAVGTFDAADINYASEYLSELVKKNNISPKILVVHRFTRGMITNYRDINTRPEVQLVMHMDGWGGPAKKINTYKQFIYEEPVQFTGFKLFYKNDTKSNNRLLTPHELLQLKPRPVYIQYQ